MTKWKKRAVSVSQSERWKCEQTLCGDRWSLTQKIQTRQIQSGNYKKIKNTETKGERWKCDNSTVVRCYNLEAIMKKWK